MISGLKVGPLREVKFWRVLGPKRAELHLACGHAKPVLPGYAGVPNRARCRACIRRRR